MRVSRSGFGRRRKGAARLPRLFAAEEHGSDDADELVARKIQSTLHADLDRRGDDAADRQLYFRQRHHRQRDQLARRLVRHGLVLLSGRTASTWIERCRIAAEAVLLERPAKRADAA